MPIVASMSNFWGWPPIARSSTRSGPERVPYRGPIFINDAVMPWGKETMLLDRLRKDAVAALSDQDSDA